MAKAKKIPGTLRVLDRGDSSQMPEYKIMEFEDTRECRARLSSVIDNNTWGTFFIGKAKNNKAFYILEKDPSDCSWVISWPLSEQMRHLRLKNFDAIIEKLTGYNYLGFDPGE